MRSLLLLLLLSLLTGCSRFEATPAEVASRVESPPREIRQPAVDHKHEVLKKGQDILIEGDDILIEKMEMSLENDARILAQLAEIKAALSDHPVTPTDPPADEAAHWSELADMVESEDIETVQQLLAVIDDLAASGHLADVSRVRALRGTTGPITDVARIVRMLLGSQPPPGTESPFPSDQLRVLIVYERTGVEPPWLAALRLWMYDQSSVEWASRDDDLTDSDLSDEPDWIRAAYAVPRSSQPWLVVGSPNGGYSGPLASAEQAREIIEEHR